MDNIVHTFVVPTPIGTAHAVATPMPNPRRAVILGLLQGGASQPVPLARLAELAGLADRKAAGAELFKLQRRGWLSGELEPFAPPTEPLQQSLPALLTLLSDHDKGLLADENGLCIAATGYADAQARRMCALAASSYSVQERFREELEEADAMPLTMILEGIDPEHAITTKTFYVGRRRFHLLVTGDNKIESPAFVRLIAVLARRYLGEV